MTPLFSNQELELSDEARVLIQDKVEFLENDPFHFDRLHYSLPLYKIRFSDRRKSKRLIYLVKGSEVRLLFILDRKNGYRDLEHYLKLI